MPRKDAAASPHVGIFWVVSGHLLIKSTPVPEGEDYGDFKTHPRGHDLVWRDYQRIGTVPPEVEYEEFPRGRVMYNTKTRRFTLLADRCILRDKAMVSAIMLAMRLPASTVLDTDLHYRCSVCLSRAARDEG